MNNFHLRWRGLVVLSSVATIITVQHSGPLQAQTESVATATTYRVGLRSIAIPAPTGDLVEMGSDFRVLAEPLAPVSNRLVAAFVTPTDLKALQSQPSTTLSTYALAETVRPAEFVNVTPAIYLQAADATKQQFGSSDTWVKDVQEQLNRTIKSLNSNVAATLDKPIFLGTLFEKTDETGYGMILPVTVSGTTRKMVAGLALLRVKDRLLMGYFYTELKDDGTVAYVRSTTEHWADSILAANK